MGLHFFFNKFYSLGVGGQDPLCRPNAELPK
jgi:hypothetical protein